MKRTPYATQVLGCAMSNMPRLCIPDSPERSPRSCAGQHHQWSGAGPAAPALLRPPGWARRPLFQEALLWQLPRGAPASLGTWSAGCMPPWRALPALAGCLPDSPGSHPLLVLLLQAAPALAQQVPGAQARQPSPVAGRPQLQAARMCGAGHGEWRPRCCPAMTAGWVAAKQRTLRTAALHHGTTWRKHVFDMRQVDA